MSRDAVLPGPELAALDRVGGLDGARVLEVGCGDGRLTFQYAARSTAVLGIDPEEELIAKARERAPAALAGLVRFEVASAVDLEQPPAAFDAIFLSHSL